MNELIFLVLLGIGLPDVTAVAHTYKNFYTASAGIQGFPEFVIVSMVDDVQTIYCDSNIQKLVPKQDWMNKVSEGDPQYWERQSQICMGTQQTFKANIEVAKQRFNQTRGVHIYQYMYGCEWDDETGVITGFEQDGYDGEDFVSWDMKSETFIAARQKAEMTKNKWNNDKTLKQVLKNYLTQQCPEWLKKYVDYGKSSLMRTDRPSVSFLQKSTSSPVSCFATGFYPNKAEMFWRKDGEEIHDGVVKGEILPNNDGAFQMSVNIDLSSVPTEDWPKYECVFQLSGVNDITQGLEKAKILINESNTSNLSILLIVALAVLGLIGVGGVTGFILYKKKKNAKRPPSPVENARKPEETKFLPEEKA